MARVHVNLCALTPIRDVWIRTIRLAALSTHPSPFTTLAPIVPPFEPSTRNPLFTARGYLRETKPACLPRPPTRYCFLVRRLFAVISSLERDRICDTSNPRVIGVPFYSECSVALDRCTRNVRFQVLVNTWNKSHNVSSINIIFSIFF